MKFDEFDAKMRVFEEAHDHCVLPGMRVVVRLDGRNFTRLTKETLSLKRPFDIRFRVSMGLTARHVMDCGFRALYAYVQSDEISMLLHPEDVSFDRKERKLISILAGEASSAFTRFIALEMQETHGETISFDARVSQLPSDEDVVDYFRWRQADARRNARNSHVYWMLRDAGLTPKKADREAAKMSWDEKRRFLLEGGIDVDALPGWQTHGTGVVWEKYEKIGIDPRTGEEKKALRNRLAIVDLPEGDAYGQFVRDLLPGEER